MAGTKPSPRRNPSPEKVIWEWAPENRSLSQCVNLPGFHVAYLFLTHSHAHFAPWAMGRAHRQEMDALRTASPSGDAGGETGAHLEELQRLRELRLGRTPAPQKAAVLLGSRKHQRGHPETINRRWCPKMTDTLCGRG